MSNDAMNAQIVSMVRDCAKKVTGGNCVFVDDDLFTLTMLAQRAVIAGLTTDADQAWVEKARTASMPHKKDHETALGHRIRKATAEKIG